MILFLGSSVEPLGGANVEDDEDETAEDETAEDESAVNVGGGAGGALVTGTAGACSALPRFSRPWPGAGCAVSDPSSSSVEGGSGSGSGSGTAAPSCRGRFWPAWPPPGRVARTLDEMLKAKMVQSMVQLLKNRIFIQNNFKNGGNY
jgi:hypothetical protein